MQAQSHPAPEYIVNSRRDDIVKQALELLQNEIQQGPLMTSPQEVRDYLIIQAGSAADRNIERFGVLFLDSQHRFIEFETLFTGTLTQTHVYPRELVRKALAHNAAAVILTHNHPSGSLEPSRSDEALTQTLKSALALVDVRVLDHIITAGGQARSMAEMGLV
jgi:DNA repair protein RadC